MCRYSNKRRRAARADREYSSQLQQDEFFWKPQSLQSPAESTDQWRRWQHRIFETGKRRCSTRSWRQAVQHRELMPIYVFSKACCQRVESNMRKLPSWHRECPTSQGTPIRAARMAADANSDRLPQSIRRAILRESRLVLWLPATGKNQSMHLFSWLQFLLFSVILCRVGGNYLIKKRGCCKICNSPLTLTNNEISLIEN